MGFFLRKSFGFGPFRLNLSKSGLGASFGVKGARIGINPKGRAYVHAGRGGFYCRETLQPSERQDGRPTTPQAPMEDEAVRQIDSRVAWSLTDDKTHWLLVAELTRVRKRTSRRLSVSVLSTILLIGLSVGLAVSVNTPETIPVSSLALTALLIFAAVCCVLAFLRARAVDERDGKVTVNFDFDPETLKRFQALSAALNRLSMCQRVWAVESKQNTRDWKRNAGATNLVRRTLVQMEPALPKGVESNHQVMCLPAGRQRLYFFPNALVVYDAQGIGAISYNGLKCEAETVTFTEAEGAPSDGQVLRHTWRYTNKSGGPDRRFSNNEELPVMRYGSLALMSDRGFDELFYVSNPDLVEPIKEALDALRAVRIETRRAIEEATAEDRQ